MEALLQYLLKLKSFYFAYPSHICVAQLFWAAVLLLQLGTVHLKKDQHSNFHYKILNIISALFFLQQQLFFAIFVIILRIYHTNKARIHYYNTFSAIAIFASMSIQSGSLISFAITLHAQNFASKILLLNNSDQKSKKGVRNFLPQILSASLMFITLFYFAKHNTLGFDVNHISKLPHNVTSLIFIFLFTLSCLSQIIDINFEIWYKKFQTNSPSTSTLILVMVPNYIITMGLVRFFFIHCQNFLPQIIPVLNIALFATIISITLLFFRDMLLTRFINSFAILTTTFSLLMLNVLRNDFTIKTFSKTNRIIAFYFSAQFISMLIFVISIQPILIEFKTIKSFDYIKGLWKKDKATSISLIISAMSLSGIFPPTMGFFVYFRILKLFVKTNTNEVFLFVLLVSLLVANLKFCSKIITYVIFYPPDEKYRLSQKIEFQRMSFAIAVILMFGFLIKDILF